MTPYAHRIAERQARYEAIAKQFEAGLKHGGLLMSLDDWCASLAIKRNTFIDRLIAFRQGEIDAGKLFSVNRSLDSVTKAVIEMRLAEKGQRGLE